MPRRYVILASHALTSRSAKMAHGVIAYSSDTIVAVIDSGLDITSPEFAGRLWTNPGEIGGNGLDDDHDGYVDDVHGWNFLNNSPDLSDAETHGTHVTGILAATGNNGIGVAGVNWAAKIMPLKFIGADGNGDVWRSANGYEGFERIATGLASVTGVTVA